MIKLDNIHVLITRPHHQATSLQASLETLGATVTLLPTINIIASSAQAQQHLQQLIAALDTFDYAIFVSANAVQACQPLWPTSTQTSVIAIGPGTQRALQKADMPCNILATHPSSEGLLELNELQRANLRIAIFCGANPRPLLQETLEQRGATVELGIAYQRQRPQPLNATQLTALQQNPISYIVSTSSESLINLWEMFNPTGSNWLAEQQLVVISEKMRAHALQLGFHKPALLAANAADQAIVDAILASSSNLQ